MPIGDFHKGINTEKNDNFGLYRIVFCKHFISYHIDDHERNIKNGGAYDCKDLHDKFREGEDYEQDQHVDNVNASDPWSRPC
ncbi:unnamed protein product [Protopolystoma xenopodis]|uniref:Uncharacterized protein n=1 Tax=Protopolystoma xenopodis TaxID=117903 RepID=A0A3S5CNF2_9PLAT|nr:unnamed protein product [Protopolystoma xenopodis]